MVTAVNAVEVPLFDAMREITIDIRITQRLRTAIRLWVAAHLFSFAGWVSGCKVEISIRPRPGRKGSTPKRRHRVGSRRAETAEIRHF